MSVIQRHPGNPILTKAVVPHPVSTVRNAGAVKTPIKTQRGWPHIQHGVYPTMAGTVCRLGVALGGLADPARLQGVAGMSRPTAFAGVADREFFSNRLGGRRPG